MSGFPDFAVRRRWDVVRQSSDVELMKSNRVSEVLLESERCLEHEDWSAPGGMSIEGSCSSLTGLTEVERVCLVVLLTRRSSCAA